MCPDLGGRIEDKRNLLICFRHTLNSIFLPVLYEEGIAFAVLQEFFPEGFPLLYCPK